MKDIIKYSVTIFAILLLVYLGINIYNSKLKTNVNKNEKYTQSVQKEDSKYNKSIQEEKNQELGEKEQKEEKQDNKENSNNNTNNQTSNNTNQQDNNNNSNNNNSNNNNNNNNNTNNNSNDRVEEEKQDTSKQFTATFYIGKKLYAENCTTTGDTCKVKSPTISVEGYEVVGWSTNSNSKTAEFTNNSEITLNSDKTFYGIIRKRIDIAFTNSITNEKEVKTCYMYNDETGCNVTSPTINTNKKYIGIGWSNKPNEKQSSWSTNTDRKVSESKTYYSIIRSKNPLRVSFDVQDANAAATSSIEEICYLYNNENSCKIIVPTLKAKTNAEVYGWSIAKNSKTGALKGGETLTITTNREYYAITKLKIIVTFDKNTSFNKNTVEKSNNQYKIEKVNIGAENLSFIETYCYSYNGNGCKVTKVPIIYSKGNEIRGFAETSDGGPINVYQKTFKSNTTLYARVFNNTRRDTLSTYYYGTLGNMPIEMETSLSEQSRNIYWNYIKQLYSDMPELFDADGKMTLLTQGTYSIVVEGSSAGITGGHVPNVLINIPTNVVLDTEREATIVHELAHALGDKYGRRTNHYPETDNEMINLFNKYKTYSIKPLRDYAYVHINEFYAEMFRFAYEEKYHRGTGIGSPTNEYTYRTTPEIMKIVDRYICVARNNYNEEEPSCK